MKRTLNAAGLAAVASGVEAAVALADPKLSEAVVDAEPIIDPTAVVEAKVEDPAPVAKVEDPAAPAVAAPVAKVEDPAPVAAADSAALLDRLVKLSGELATAQAELATLKTADATKDTQFKALTKIAADSVNRMEVPLARTPTNFKDASAETVLSAYHSVISAFNSQFKVGGVVEVPSTTDLSLAAKPSGYIPDPSMASL